MKQVVGIDGCPAGWVCCAMSIGSSETTSARVFMTFADVLTAFPEASVLAIDVPIGLLDSPEPGGREVDRLVRGMLGPGRGTSVFPAPARAVLNAASYAQARELSKASSPHAISLSAQAFNIVAKIKEVDDLVSPALQDRVLEVHPELCFAQMQGGLEPSKKTDEGRELRAQLLAKQGFSDVAGVLRSVPRRLAAIDDVLDAMAACWTAGRIATGVARRFPTGEPARDARGLRMEMWC